MSCDATTSATIIDTGAKHLKEPISQRFFHPKSHGLTIDIYIFPDVYLSCTNSLCSQFINYIHKIIGVSAYICIMDSIYDSIPWNPMHTSAQCIKARHRTNALVVSQMQVCAKPTASSGHDSENHQNRWIGTIWIWCVCVCTRKVARLKYTLSQYIATIYTLTYWSWIYNMTIYCLVRSTMIYVRIGNALCSYAWYYVNIVIFVIIFYQSAIVFVCIVQCLAILSIHLVTIHQEVFDLALVPLLQHLLQHLLHTSSAKPGKRTNSNHHVM